jgi:hypothetical protein
MKLGTILLANGILGLGYGLVLLAVPAQFLQLYGVELGGPGPTEIARLLGASLFGYGALGVLARAETSPSGAVATGFLVADGLGFLVTLHGMLTGASNALGWSSVGIYLALTAAFAYLRFAAPAAAPATH